MSLQQKTVDALQDAAEAMGAIAEVLATRETKVVVNVPKSPAAPAPEVHVTNAPAPPAEVTVELKAHSWKFEVTQRDANGFIKIFTAAPTS